MGISWIIMCYNPPVGNRKAYEQLYLFYQPTMVCGTFHDRLMATPLARMPIENPYALRPLAITFDSEDRFYFCNDTHRVP